MSRFPELDACAWSHDGDGWSLIVGGACPVQGAGFIDGHPVYFRARGGSWSIRIAKDHDADPVAVGDSAVPGWTAWGEYGSFPDAGWMSAEHSRAIVEACVAAFRTRPPLGTMSALIEGVPGGPAEVTP